MLYNRCTTVETVSVEGLTLTVDMVVLLTVVVDVFVVIVVSRERAVERRIQLLSRWSLHQFHRQAVSAEVDNTTELVAV